MEYYPEDEHDRRSSKLERKILYGVMIVGFGMMGAGVLMNSCSGCKSSPRNPAPIQERQEDYQPERRERGNDLFDPVDLYWIVHGNEYA